MTISKPVGGIQLFACALGLVALVGAAGVAWAGGSDDDGDGGRQCSEDGGHGRRKGHYKDNGHQHSRGHQRGNGHGNGSDEGDCSDGGGHGGDPGCDDGNVCNGVETFDGKTCRAGTPLNCDDGNPCTIDQCDAKTGCSHTPIAGCVPCRTAADCCDGDRRTTDICDENGVCRHEPHPEAPSCRADWQCHDGNPCTVDTCGTDGSCGHTALPGCQPCSHDADCDDRDACSDDSCANGVCVHTRQATCPACDGPGACSDPTCHAAPQCASPKEICGDCIDNDGNGLTDFEDPACCEETTALAIRNMMLKAVHGKKDGKDLQLRARFTIFTPAGFDPMMRDTTLQISDANGPIVCQTMPASEWKSVRKGVYRYAGEEGLYRGGFTVKHDRRIVFQTVGKNMGLRAIDPNKVIVTVRAGGICAQSMTNLRGKKTPRVFRHPSR